MNTRGPSARHWEGAGTGEKQRIYRCRWYWHYDGWARVWYAGNPGLAGERGDPGPATEERRRCDVVWGSKGGDREGKGGVGRVRQEKGAEWETSGKRWCMIQGKVGSSRSNAYACKRQMGVDEGKRMHRHAETWKTVAGVDSYMQQKGQMGASSCGVMNGTNE